MPVRPRAAESVIAPVAASAAKGIARTRPGEPREAIVERPRLCIKHDRAYGTALADKLGNAARAGLRQEDVAVAVAREGAVMLSASRNCSSLLESSGSPSHMARQQFSSRRGKNGAPPARGIRKLCNRKPPRARRIGSLAKSCARPEGLGPRRLSN